MRSILCCWSGRPDSSVAFLLVLLSIAISSAWATQNVAYRAAVYEHVVTSPPRKVVNRVEAVENMMKNVRVYETQTKIAAGQGAKIIVFPEYGILGINLGRVAVKSYLEEIPDPRCVSWNPSENPNTYSGTEIQRELSRIAKENKIYMVVNLGTKVSCTTKEDSSCPSDGQYQFNTNVVYSDKGVLVAVYHKRNLYIDLPFDPAPAPEYVTFDTPFGRFGTVICFDLMFEKPTKVLFEKYKVRNLAYPTAWVKITPFYRSLMVHSSIARAYSVNILAADLHSSQHHAHGSGLYSPTGAKVYFYNTTSGASKLLIADMDAISEDTPLPRSADQPKINPVNKPTPTKGSVLGLEFQFIPLTARQAVVSFCNGGFCCTLDYEKKMQQTTEKYVLGVGNGLFYVNDDKLYSQVCTLSKCYGVKCVAEITGANTIFERFTLTGHNFKTSEVLARVVAMNGSSYALVDDEWTYNYTSRIYMDGSMSLPLHSAVLEGRVFEKDQPNAPKAHKPDLPKCKKDTNGSSSDRHGSKMAVILPLLICVLVHWKD